MIKQYKVSDETRRRMSISGKGRIFSELHKKRISLSHLNNNFRLGKPHSEETKFKIALFRLGKKHSEETKQKMRIARSKRKIPFKDTGIEKKLQRSLKELNIPFKVQYPLKLSKGFHQADIFIEPNIIIEADGDYWHNRPKTKIRDAFVNQDLENQGYKIYRFWEHEILNS